MRTTTSSARRWILSATILGSSVTFLASSAVSVALPTIQNYFGSNIAGIEWVTTAQMLSLASLLILAGALGDRFGRRRLFIYGILLFGTMSVLSGVAPSIGILITFQAVQGIGAAMMVPQSLAIINASFPEEQRGRAIGLWAGLSGAIGALGPFVGGWLIQTFSWRYVFFVNVPIAIITLLVTLKFVPESKSPDIRKLDWPGAVFLLLGLIGVTYGLVSGPVSGWTQTLVLAGLLGGALFLTIFGVNEVRQQNPLIAAQIFENPVVAGANIATFLIYFALNGVFFLVVLNLQQIQHYSPVMTGLGLLPPIVLIALLSSPAGALADKIGPRIPMIVAPIILSLATIWLALLGNKPAYAGHFLVGMALFGVGMALVIAPLTKCALSVKSEFSGAASGVNNAVARLTALMAVAILGLVLVSTFGARLHRAITTSDLPPPQQAAILAQSAKVGGIIIPDSFDQDSRTIAERAINDSFIYGFRWALALCTLLVIAAAITSAFAIRNPTRVSI